jgi:glycine C-acetyltransferase
MDEGESILKKMRDNINLFKNLALKMQINLATDSNHAIQPVLIGDSKKSKYVSSELFNRGYLVTSINYPVVAKGRDEIRVQISATHTAHEIEGLIDNLKQLV